MKVMIIGSGPLPRENRGIANAAGLRTEQFVCDIEGVHDILLVTIEGKEENAPVKREEKKINGKYMRHVSLFKGLSNLHSILRKKRNTYAPDIIIGVNTFPAFLASTIVPKNTPFWADLNGWSLTEMQAQAYSMNTNAFLHKGLSVEQTILKRADKVSVVSTPQKHACMGELAMLGRLTKDTFRHRFVDVVENACLPLRPHERKKKRDIFRGILFPREAVVGVWIGGFNAWADEKTLFDGVEKVMSHYENFHFVYTGDILPGIEEKKFPYFQKKSTALSI